MKANSTSTPRKGKGSNLSPSSETSRTSEAKAQPYVPTPIETKALAAYKAAKEGAGRASKSRSMRAMRAKLRRSIPTYGSALSL